MRNLSELIQHSKNNHKSLVSTFIDLPEVDKARMIESILNGTSAQELELRKFINQSGMPFRVILDNDDDNTCYIVNPQFPTDRIRAFIIKTISQNECEITLGNKRSIKVRDGGDDFDLRHESDRSAIGWKKLFLMGLEKLEVDNSRLGTIALPSVAETISAFTPNEIAQVISMSASKHAFNTRIITNLIKALSEVEEIPSGLHELEPFLGRLISFNVPGLTQNLSTRLFDALRKLVLHTNFSLNSNIEYLCKTLYPRLGTDDIAIIKGELAYSHPHLAKSYLERNRTGVDKFAYSRALAEALDVELNSVDPFIRTSAEQLAATDRIDYYKALIELALRPGFSNRANQKLMEFVQNFYENKLSLIRDQKLQNEIIAFLNIQIGFPIPEGHALQNQETLSYYNFRNLSFSLIFQIYIDGLYNFNYAELRTWLQNEGCRKAFISALIDLDTNQTFKSALVYRCVEQITDQRVRTLRQLGDPVGCHISFLIEKDAEGRRLMFEVLTPQEIRDYARELGIFNLILELNFSEFYKLYKNNPGALEAILLICSPAARLINAIQNGYTYLDQKLSGGLTALALLTILPLSFGAIGAFANQQYVSLNQVLCCSTVIGLCTFSLMSAIHYPLSMLHDYLVQRMPNREEMINDIKHIILLTPALIASPALMLCLANKAFTYNVESTGGYMAIEVVKHIGKQFLDFNSVIFSSLAETTLSTGQAVQFAAEEYGSTACQVVAAAAIAYCSARALGLEIALNR